MTLPRAAGASAATGPAEDAARAQRESQVHVREVIRLAELAMITELYEQIWRPSTNPVMGTELLRALSTAGNYVAGAFDGATLVGACVGFFAAPTPTALHSHIAGVSASVSGRHVGYALKLHQRAWALDHGITSIDWTFDPLVARNAYFNIVKLGGLPTEYLPNFYGDMADGINGDDDTDRLLLRWDLTSDRAAAAGAGRFQPAPPGGVLALGRDDNDRPLTGATDADTVLVAVPRDVEALRLKDPGAAKDWRIAVRDVLGGLLADGALVTGFARDGWYVVQR